MYIKLTATFFLFFTYSISISQIITKDSSYNCVAYWEKGEEKVLLINRMTQNIKSGKEEPAFNFSFEASISILDSTKEGYKVQWIFQLPEKVKKAEPGLAELMPVYNNLKMVFLTDELGSFKELINWQEVKDAYIKMMEVSLPKNINDSTRKNIDKSYDFFNSKQMVESSMIKEIQLYYSPFGSNFSVSAKTTPTALPSPFSEESIPATITEKITEMSQLSDHVKFVTDMNIDLANASALFEGIFRKLNIPDDSVTVKAKELLAEFEIKDHTEFYIVPSTGWIKNVNYQRISRSFQTTKKETIVFELK